MTRVPPPAEWRDKVKWQQVTSHDHFTWSPTTISDNRITYHDPCQTARRVMMALPPPSVIMTTQNISPPLKKNKSFWYYIYQPSHKEEGKLAIPNKRSTDYLSLTMADKTIGGCIRTPRPDAFCRWNDLIKNQYWLRSRVHPFGNHVDHQGREASTTTTFICVDKLRRCDTIHWVENLFEF